MAEPNIAANVRQLVFERVHTIEQLESLLLLHAQQGQAFTAERAAAELRMPPELVSTAFEHLVASGLAAERAPRSWSYAPATPALAGLVEMLACAYKTSQVELIVLIASNAMDRVRNAGLRAFAQAFLVKGPKKDG